MMPVKGFISIDGMSMVKDGTREFVGVMVWRYLLDEIWNHIERHLGMDYMTPWADHEGAWNDWIGNVR